MRSEELTLRRHLVEASIQDAKERIDLATLIAKDEKQLTLKARLGELEKAIINIEELFREFANDAQAGRKSLPDGTKPRRKPVKKRAKRRKSKKLAVA